MKFKLVEKLNITEYDNEGNELSSEQIAFFKDSKVRDSLGRLLVCYHGTDKEFDVFEIGDGGYHFGDKDTAVDRHRYIKGSTWNLKKCYLNLTKPLIIDYDNEQWNGSSIALVWLFGTSYEGADEFLQGTLKATDELIPTEFKNDFEEICKIAKMWSPKDKSPLGADTVEMHKLLRRHGYDGIMYLNAFEGSNSYSYLVFNSNQIKSITNKTPTSSSNINEKHL